MDLSHIWQILVDNVLHIDKNLLYITQNYGNLSYLFIFTVIFCETGLVFMGFLPGDSLLFYAGTLAALGAFNPHLLVLLIIIGAILGDYTNFTIGSKFGLRALQKYPKLFNKENLAKTEAFYLKHGNKTIVIARFVPIVRSFAPFVAGIAKMDQKNFTKYNVIGAFFWATSVVYMGYFLGNLPFIKQHNGLVILTILILSALPIVIEFIKVKLRKA